jgi:hypothetical protein
MNYRCYNTTYITIASSVLLLYEFRTKERPTTNNIALIESAIEILEAMDESVVARSAAEVIKHFLRELKSTTNGTSDSVAQPDNIDVQQAPTPGPWASLDVSHYLSLHNTLSLYLSQTAV